MPAQVLVHSLLQCSPDFGSSHELYEHTRWTYVERTVLHDLRPGLNTAC